MICYKDMTFCKHYKDCAIAYKCHRPLTPEVQADADKWWKGEGAPIAIFMEQPSCHVKLNELL
jgi:hypothetical protein